MTRTALHDARAVLRLMERRDRQAAKLRALDDAFKANARALLRRKGIYGALSDAAVRNIAEAEIRPVEKAA